MVKRKSFKGGGGQSPRLLSTPNTYRSGTIERIYELPHRQVVPPQRYADFLAQSVDRFLTFLFEKHKVDNLADMTEKYVQSVRRFNPDRTVEQLRETSCLPLRLEILAKISARGMIKKDTGKLQRSNEYERYIDRLSGLSIEQREKQLRERVSRFKKALSETYPGRKGRVPSKVVIQKGSKKEEYDWTKFNFELRMTANQSGLAVNLSLCSYGSITSIEEGSFNVPAISIRAQNWLGSTRIPAKIVDALEEVVHVFYEPQAIEHRTSYIDRSPIIPDKSRKLAQ